MSLPTYKARRPIDCTIMQLLNSIVVVRREDKKVLAGFPNIPGCDPWCRHDDARDFCRDMGLTFVTDRTKP